jgi:outer membrane lipoprotein-sorting protein
MIPAMPPPRSSVHSVATPIAAALVACHVGLLIAVLAPDAHAQALAALLDGVADNARFATPTRADVRITCGEGCTAAGRPAILLGRGDAIYLEVRDGVRALVRPGHVLVARDGRAAPATVGESLAGSDVLLEDLAVFTPAALKVPQISDDGPAGVVVTAAPSGPSPYALIVHTIARDRRTIVRTLYYREHVNELAKTRRDDGFVEIGGRWRPGDVTVESVRTGTTTHLALSWKEAPDVPATLFEPAGLERPSGLAWP